MSNIPGEKRHTPGSGRVVDSNLARLDNSCNLRYSKALRYFLARVYHLTEPRGKDGGFPVELGPDVGKVELPSMRRVSNEGRHMDRCEPDLPVALQNAYERLDKEISDLGDTADYRNAGAVRKAMEQFVRQWGRVTGRLDELEQRASLVARECCQGSVYEQRMEDAFNAYYLTSKDMYGPYVVIVEPILRRLKPGYGLRCRSEVSSLIEVVDLAMRAGLMPDGCRADFADWRRECQRIVDDAEDVGADGCRDLMSVYRVRYGSPSGMDNLETTLLMTGAGRSKLPLIRSAAKLLMEWAGQLVRATDPVREYSDRRESSVVVQESARAGELKTDAVATRQTTHRSNQSRMRGGARDKLIAGLTKHHEYANGGCLNQEPIGCG